ncbi:MAG: DNA mismatch repair endonuclease MutL [Flavobacteriales bacterium]|nr:DNA mismatch repair endonuclease MutL [Flavobacteriales bacterium]
MPNIINVLSDQVANQIAAGEVIQRPASAIKELVENAVDSGATSVKVIVKDAGKTLLQVIDNGCGMSEADAKMCLERHATSKINKTEDLFNIRTMGFRGEALASIAAIAHVEIKTKRHEDDLGTQVNIEGGEIIGDDACGCSDGTSIAVKNLFYNVPARRNFLKSDPVELKHIIDEFQRVALAYPGIAFSLFNNDNEVFHLTKSTFRQRIVGVFGRNYNQKLVPVEESAQVVGISGFVSKPEFARKTRGEQFFFVNKRFIKNGYLHHAIQNAFQDLVAKEYIPSYFIFLELDPKTIDINIHPTKTEVKFENDRAIYAILLAAVKKALGEHNIAPMLDFDRENSFDVPPLKKGEFVSMPEIKVDTSYNPFEQGASIPGVETQRKPSTENWEELYKPAASLDNQHVESELNQSQLELEAEEDHAVQARKPIQIHRRYIISQIKSGLIVIDQQNASERINYEKNLLALQNSKTSVQKTMFSKTIELSVGDFELASEMKDDINALGFDIREFGKNTIVVEGVPADSIDDDPESLLERLLELYKDNIIDLKIEKQDNLARSLAKSTCIKAGRVLEEAEMSILIDELFACNMPYYTANGNPTVTTLSIEELNAKFGK